MSILQKILQDMYVEPDLLAELDDEQKQILFCKMREEQLRRWATHEKEWEEKERQQQNSSGTENGSLSSTESRRVRWLVGGDGKPWVWVMGEHSSDKTIEQILEEETQEKAQRLAEQEGEELRRLREEELKEKLRQEQFEAEEERMKTERQKQLAAAQQAQEDEEVRRRIEQEKARKLRESEQAAMVAARSRQAQEAFLKRELEQQQHEQGQWHDDTEESEVERRVVLREDPKEQQELVERRRSEIYQTLTEARERANREADKEAEEERRYWEDQERKAREAEDQIRSIARRAREQHKQHGLRTSTSLLSVLKTESQTQRKPQSTQAQEFEAVDGLISAMGNIDSTSGSGTSSPVVTGNNAMKLPRPPKPQSREAIVEWYLKEELPSGSGLETGSSRFAPWFHGIIGREEAEQMLKPPRPPGSFLVRVSARIWGYAISYNVDGAGGRVKHFLIEKVTENGGGYQLYGTNQLVHASLWDLITYHQTVPITVKGGELLKEPVGQVRFPPDYQELLGFGSSSGPAALESGRRQRP